MNTALNIVVITNKMIDFFILPSSLAVKVKTTFSYITILSANGMPADNWYAFDAQFGWLCFLHFCLKSIAVK